MYCPMCFNNTLKLQSKGVVDIIINSKQMDAGRFLFNAEASHRDEMIRDLTLKIEEFFKWYSNFHNIEPINVIELLTADMKCDQGCAATPNMKFSIVDVLIPAAELKEILLKLGKKYNMEIKLKEDE